jgi:hypothetical protein
MKVRPLNHPDRSIDLQQGLDILTEQTIAKLIQAGFSTADVLTAWDEVLNNRWLLLDEDPDPADDPEDVLDWKPAMF